MNGRFLVVDDSLTVRIVLQDFLAKSGVPVDRIATAEDGEQALEAFRRLRPDVVFLDIEMPRLDGHAAGVAMLADDPRVRIVVTTSVDRDDPRVRDLLARGAFDLVEKPVRLERVKGILRILELER